MQDKGKRVLLAHTVAKEWEESKGAGIGCREAKKVGEDGSLYKMVVNTLNGKSERMIYKGHPYVVFWGSPFDTDPIDGKCSVGFRVD